VRTAFGVDCVAERGAQHLRQDAPACGPHMGSSGTFTKTAVPPYARRLQDFRRAVRALAELSLSSRKNPGRMSANHPERSPSAGINRQILSSSAVVAALAVGPGSGRVHRVLAGALVAAVHT
jgi:hypothetical protein